MALKFEVLDIVVWGSCFFVLVCWYNTKMRSKLMRPNYLCLQIMRIKR